MMTFHHVGVHSKPSRKTSSLPWNDDIYFFFSPLTPFGFMLTRGSFYNILIRTSFHRDKLFNFEIFYANVVCECVLAALINLSRVNEKAQKFMFIFLFSES